MSDPEPSEPTTIVAGTTVSWTRSAPAYPAVDDWALRYGFCRDDGSERIGISGVDGGQGEYTVTLDVAISQQMGAGSWYWQAVAERPGSPNYERYLLASGRLTVVPNLITTAADARSHAEKVLAALQQLIERQASKGLSSYTLPNGVTVSNRDPEALIRWRDHYLGELQRLEREERMSQGLGHGGRIHLRI